MHVVNEDDRSAVYVLRFLFYIVFGVQKKGKWLLYDWAADIWRMMNMDKDSGLFHRIKEVWISQKVDVYHEEVQRRNYNSFNYFLIVGTAVSFMVLIYGMVLHRIVTFNTEFLMMFCYCGGLLLLSKCFLKKHVRYITPVFYLAMTPLMVMSILMGTFLDPKQPAITVMVFLGVLPVFLLDKFWRTLSYITVNAAAFAVCCYIAKDSSMFMADMVDLVTFFFLAAGVNCFVYIERIASVETYVEFRNKSETDPLTGIFNRGAGVEKIEALINRNIYGAFVILDIDDFKYINDAFGHNIGDEALRAAAVILKEVFSEKDIVLRMGGDEFAVYAVGITDREACIQLFSNLFSAIKTVKISSSDDVLRISVGCCIHDAQTETFEQLYKSGDECLYEAKRNGKNCYYIRKT